MRAATSVALITTRPIGQETKLQKLCKKRKPEGFEKFKVNLKKRVYGLNCLKFKEKNIERKVFRFLFVLLVFVGDVFCVRVVRRVKGIRYELRGLSVSGK